MTPPGAHCAGESEPGALVAVDGPGHVVPGASSTWATETEVARSGTTVRSGVVAASVGSTLLVLSYSAPAADFSWSDLEPVLSTQAARLR
jgi:hypothetical protein